MRRPWNKAVFALTLLGVHALGILASTYDFHAHAHTVCPEHGEVLHGEEHHAVAVQAEYALIAEHTQKHAHCALAPHFRPENARVALPELRSVDDYVSASTAIAVENTRPHAEALYRLAPKNSPPV